MPGGRPTKLTPALIKKAKAFVEARRADRMLLPTVEGLALELGIHKDTVYEWCDPSTEGATPDHPNPSFVELWKLRSQFSDVLAELKNAQAEKLMQFSLTGKYNSTIAKLLLSAKHGVIEKSQQDLTTNGKDLPAPILGGATKGGDDE